MCYFEKTKVIILCLTIILPNAVLADKGSYINPSFSQIVNKNDTFNVAVFPVQNMSNDSDISIIFRKRIVAQLIHKGYNAVNSQVLDQKLLALGVQNENHLSLLSIATIAKLSSADALMFGIIETAAEQHAVVFNGFAYTASLKMLDKDGEELWYKLSERIAKRRFSIDPVNMLFDYVLTDMSEEKSKAAMALADRTIKDLPSTKVEIVTDNLFNRALEVEAK